MAALSLTPATAYPAVVGGVTDRPMCHLVAHTAQINTVAFIPSPSPDFGPLLLTGDASGLICLWDVKYSLRLARWEAHTAGVLSFFAMRQDVTRSSPEIRVWSFSRDGSAACWHFHLEEDAHAPPQRVHTVAVGSDGLCAPTALQMCAESGVYTFDDDILVACPNAVHAEQIDVTRLHGGEATRLFQLSLPEELLATLDYAEEDFLLRGREHDKWELLRKKTGMAMALRLTTQCCAIPTHSGGPAWEESDLPTATVTSDGPQHPEIDSLRELLALDREPAAPTPTTRADTATSERASPAPTPVLVAGFENGRLYSIGLDAGTAPPRWGVLSTATCGAEAVLAVSLSEDGSQGICTSADGSCLSFQLEQGVLRPHHKYSIPGAGASACCIISCEASRMRSLVGSGTSGQKVISVIGGWDGVVRVLDHDGGTCLRNIRPQTTSIYGVAAWDKSAHDQSDFSAALIAAGNKSGDILVWRA